MTAIDINAPAERVWAIMSDVERWPEWTASMARVERLDLGALGVGSRVRVKQPKLAQALFEITAWEPGRGFDWITRSAVVTAVARHVIAPSGPGVRVTLSVDYSGPLSGVIGWLYGGLTNRYMAMEAEGLKRRAEAPPI